MKSEREEAGFFISESQFVAGRESPVKAYHHANMPHVAPGPAWLGAELHKSAVPPCSSRHPEEGGGRYWSRGHPW